MTTESDSMLYLKSCEDIETAWRAAVITGQAPTLEPLLDEIISRLPSKRRVTSVKEAHIYLTGSDARIMRDELTASLDMAATYLRPGSTLAMAAAYLLRSLQTEEATEIR